MSALFCIEVNPETSKLVQLALFSKGYKWDSANKIQYTDQKYLYPWADKSICYGRGPDKNCLTLTIDQFSEWILTDKLPEKIVEFTINSEYTAKISKSKLVVGCQTIPKDVAVKLAREVIRVME